MIGIAMGSNLMTKFRPQQFNSRFKIKHPYKVGRYNWIPYFPWTTENYLHHVFSVLHYKSSHAPRPIRQKWSLRAKLFEQAHRRII